jgi:tetratricopeptide (TPR) repeat protein
VPHVSKKDLLRASDAGRSEVARLAAHLAGCAACRSRALSLLRDRALPAKRQVPLRTLLELAAFEEREAVERLRVRAEFAALRRLTRAAQKERLILSRLCHSLAFVDVLLAAVRAPHPREEAEFLSGLAVLAVQGMDLKHVSEAFRNDLLSSIWTETANNRRVNGEWSNAQVALARGKTNLDRGTGNPSILARWLSVGASLRADQGARDDAMAQLEECRRICEAEPNWPLVARTMVQMAHVIVDRDPDASLALLDRACVYVPLEDATLQWLAESIRAESLIILGRIEDALIVFDRAERLRPLQQRRNGKLRSACTAARLLEALGCMREAEGLFDETLTGDLHEGLHKDALLDMAYIVGFHARSGRPERAEEIGLQTLAEIEEQGTVLHDQLRRVLRGFIDAARGQTLDQNALREVDEYLRAHWKYPAPVDPVIPTGEKMPVPPAPAAALVDKALVAPLLMRALWSRIRRGTRRVQQAQVGASPECHTKEFLDLLLSELGAAESRDEAEFIAHLALRAVEEAAEPAEAREDFRAQVWTEIANVRRIAAEWNHAETALHRAHEHLGRGAGSPLLKARAQSVAASLLFDQGRRAQAVAVLEECLKLYEDAKAWPLVARTLVQTAHALVESAPECALSVAERALPFIPAEDSVLRWLTESIRTESLIEMGETGQALQAFHLAESLRGSHARPDADLRSNYTAARLLEALGRFDEAEQLFEAVIAEAFDREAYREALLDTLYLFGIHIRRDARDKAVALCRTAIARLDVPDVGHEQLRAVWTELMDAAMLRAIRLEALAEVREFLKVHWKYPASKPPRFSF